MNGAALMLIGMAAVISLVTVWADYYLKLATMKSGNYVWVLVALGGILYAITAIGWYYMMKQTSLSLVAVLYASSNLLMLVGMGIFIFGERPQPIEYIGILMALSSIFLMTRYA